jgi:hypothetical protein
MKNAAIIFIIVLSTVIKPIKKMGEPGDITRQFNVYKGGSLVVKVASGDIKVISWNKDEVDVYLKDVYEDDFNRIKINKYDNTVEVNDRGWGSDANEIVIHIPSKFNINLASSSGDLKVLGNYEGDLNASTGGGDITFDDIKGKVNVSTSGGDVTAGDVVGDISIKTMGGDISVKSVSKDAEISTNGGDIKIGEVGNYIKVTTFGGDIKIDKIGGSVETVTYGGDIIIHQVSGNVTSNTYGGDIALVGANGIVKAKSGGGDISLRRISGSIVASTGSGDVYAELNPNGKENTKISSGSGNIKLFLPENSKVNIEARIKETGWDEDKYEYEIKSDFKAQSYIRNSANDEISATYILNGGGIKIFLQTTNSDIEIKKLFK